MIGLESLTAAGSRKKKLYVDDVFSAYTYVGNGSTQTITNGIDLAGKGGMVWIKNRTTSESHFLTDTSRGVTRTLNTDATYQDYAYAGGVTSLSSSGFAVGAQGNVNGSTNSLVSWTFRNALNFYHHTVLTKSSGTSATYTFSTITTLGMVRVKRTDGSGSWYVWHRSLTAGKLLIGETTAAETALGHITVSGSTVTLVNGVIADGTYLVEAFAHYTGVDGLIQCGSFTTDGSGNATVNLGWEPQYVLCKKISGTSNWLINDSMRGYYATTQGNALYANTSGAEVQGTFTFPLADGFNTQYTPSPGTYIYLAIRRPNKPVTSGAQVYNAIARTGTGAAVTVTGVGFAPDLVSVHARSDISGTYWATRLHGYYGLAVTLTNAEFNASTGITGFLNDGAYWAGAFLNTNTITHINHFFKRAPGVFDVVCYTGTGGAKTEAHNLGVAPELMIVKNRSGSAENWNVYHSNIGNTNVGYLNLTNNFAGANIGFWNNTTPSASVFSIGAYNNVNATTYVAYLFASKTGISKVFSYTGDGTSNATKIIDCGFTTGARFVLIKRTNSTGDWLIWDTVRGISSGSDPHLSLNSTSPEVGSDSSVDPHLSGFIVNQVAATNINADTGTYIGLAFA